MKKDKSFAFSLSPSAFCLLSLALCLLPYVVLSCWLPDTYLTMQEDSFFLFTADYFRFKLSVQPAVSSWLSSLLKQFFRWPLLGALIQGLIAWLTVQCLRQMLPANKRRFDLLVLLPSLIQFCVWPFALLLQLQVLLLAFVLLIYCRLPRWWARLAWAVLLLPLGYMLFSVPLLIGLFVLFATVEWFVHKGRSRVAVVVLLAFSSLMLPPIYSQRVAFIPFENRYQSGALDAVQPLWSQELREQNMYFRVLRAAEEERWNDMRVAVRESGLMRTGLMQKYLLLSESAMGTLPENLFSYSINTPEEFFYYHERNVLTCQFNRLFYRNLGLWDEAYHHAQEYFLLLPEACCFSSLTQMVDYSIREGEYDVAEKYLTILDHAPFYGRFVREQRERMARQRTEVKFETPLRADNFVGGYPFNSEMVRLLQNTRCNRRRVYDFLLCGLLLQKNLPHFNAVVHGFPDLLPNPLPAAYAQAYRLLQTQGQVPDEECLPGTYYHYFRYVPIPEPNARMIQSAGH